LGFKNLKKLIKCNFLVVPFVPVKCGKYKGIIFNYKGTRIPVSSLFYMIQTIYIKAGFFDLFIKWVFSNK